jgi:retinol dehydrogenase 12
MAKEAKTMGRKIALVTGATSGIGKATATGLASKGFHVVLLARDAKRGAAAAEEIRGKVEGASVEVLVADLASQASVRKAAASFTQKHGRLDVLVNSAGVFLPTRQLTPDGIEATFATNYLGHFLLTNLLLPGLQAARGRVISIASKYGNTKIPFDDLMVEKRKFSFLRAVPPTKLGQVLFTQEIAERQAGTGVSAFAVHPGLVQNTNLLNDVGGFFRWMTNTFGKPAQAAADTPVWLATSSEALALNGRLVHARKALKTPGQGSDPAVRKRLWQESEKLAPLQAAASRKA